MDGETDVPTLGSLKVETRKAAVDLQEALDAPYAEHSSQEVRLRELEIKVAYKVYEVKLGVLLKRLRELGLRQEFLVEIDNKGNFMWDVELELKRMLEVKKGNLSLRTVVSDLRCLTDVGGRNQGSSAAADELCESRAVSPSSGRRSETTPYGQVREGDCDFKAFAAILERLGCYC